MKKSKWWMLPVILLAVFGLVVLGCPTDSKGSDNEGDKPAIDPAHNYAGEGGVTDVVLFNNFKWGNGWQSWGDDDKQIAWSRLANVDIGIGDTYTFKVKFTIDRDFEDDYLYACFVNQKTPGDWGPLNDDWVDCKTDEVATIPDNTLNLKAPGTYKAGAPIELEFSLSAKKMGSASTVVLVFQTRGEGTKGNPDSAVKKEVTMTFSEIFISTGDAIDVEPPEEVVEPKAPAAWGASGEDYYMNPTTLDFEKPNSGWGTISMDENVITFGGDSGLFFLKFPAAFDAEDYTTLEIGYLFEGDSEGSLILKTFYQAINSNGYDTDGVADCGQNAAIDPPYGYIKYTAAQYAKLFDEDAPNISSGLGFQAGGGLDGELTIVYLKFTK